MTAVFNIARYEAKRIFLSPLAWAVLAVVQFITGFVFINVLVDYATNAGMGGDDTVGVSDYVAGSLYGFATILLLLIMPLMTMRLFAEERKANTLTLLTSAPVSLTEIVLGKFLGLMGFVFAILLLMAAMLVASAALAPRPQASTLPPPVMQASRACTEPDFNSNSTSWTGYSRSPLRIQPTSKLASISTSSSWITRKVRVISVSNCSCSGLSV